MARFWPTPMAAEQVPEVAAGKNRAEKIAFSKTGCKVMKSGAVVVSYRRRTVSS